MQVSSFSLKLKLIFLLFRWPDQVEDTELDFADVEALFGPTVRQIVEGETKV